MTSTAGPTGGGTIIHIHGTNLFAGPQPGCGVAHFGPQINVDTDGHFEAGGSYQANGGQPEDARVTGLVSFGTVAFTIRTRTQTIGPLTFVYGSTEPCATACQ